MFSTLSSIVQLVLAGVVGLLLGLLLATLFNREPKTPAENPLPKDMTDEGYSEAGRLLYSPSTKKVITQLDGDYYRTFLELTPEQKKRVLRLLDGWNEWAGQSAKLEVITPIMPVAPVPQTPARIDPEIISDPYAAGVFSSVDPILKQGLTGQAPKQEKLEDLGIQVPEYVEPIPAVVAINTPLPNAKPKPLSIVEQINEVIKKLAENGPHQTQNVHLEEDGQQGVKVWVGLEQFAGVEEVPYLEVKQLIKAAVAKWEEETELKDK